MERPWSTIFDDELKQLRMQAGLLRETILVASAWTGKCSAEWSRLVEIAEESGIPGLVEELETIKRQHDAHTLLHSADP